MSDLITQLTADLQKQIEAYAPVLEAKDVGTVLEAGDGIARAERQRLPGRCDALLEQLGTIRLDALEETLEAEVGEDLDVPGAQLVGAQEVRRGALQPFGRGDAQEPGALR